jgi:hypothetical protein
MEARNELPGGSRVWLSSNTEPLVAVHRQDRIMASFFLPRQVILSGGPSIKETGTEDYSLAFYFIS